jgi:hypothetical protein
MSKMLDYTGRIFPRVFDFRSLFDLDHRISNPFWHSLTTWELGHTLDKMSESQKRSLNGALKDDKVSNRQYRPDRQLRLLGQPKP